TRRGSRAVPDGAAGKNDEGRGFRGLLLVWIRGVPRVHHPAQYGVPPIAPCGSGVGRNSRHWRRIAPNAIGAGQLSNVAAYPVLTSRCCSNGPIFTLAAISGRVSGPVASMRGVPLPR